MASSPKERRLPARTRPWATTTLRNGTHFLSTPLTIGDLRRQDGGTITYVVHDHQRGAHLTSQHGLGGNFSNCSPTTDVGGAANPTITPVELRRSSATSQERHEGTQITFGPPPNFQAGSPTEQRRAHECENHFPARECTLKLSGVASR